MSPIDFLWLYFILSSLQPLIQQRILAVRRLQALRALEKRNKSRGITLIHRRETLSILDIDDSEAVPDRTPPRRARRWRDRGDS
jgi:hypothetical protein